MLVMVFKKKLGAEDGYWSELTIWVDLVFLMSTLPNSRFEQNQDHPKTTTHRTQTTKTKRVLVWGFVSQIS